MKFFKLLGIGVLILLLVLVIARSSREAQSPAKNDPIYPNIESVAKTDIQAGTYTAVFTHNGVDREYLIHLPANYQANRMYPLVFVLHGGGGSAGDTLRRTEFAAKADAEGFIVVAPQGVGGNWNDGRGFTAHADTTDTVTDTDDVAFFASLITDLKSKYLIDTARIYSSGISNGSLMTQRLACDLPGVFAAIAPVSAPMRPEITASICIDPAPISVIGIQGTEDPFFPIPDSDGIPEMAWAVARTADQTVITEEEIF